MEEQHAVPQDITGFKFKLVGDMTLKQFGELAFGAIVAYLFYASGWHPLLKWPLTLFFGFFGVALAFIPIEERPLDVWILNFFRAIYRPTYYVWKKDTSGMIMASISAPPIVTKTLTPVSLSQPEPRLNVVAPILQTPQTPAVSVDELQKLRDQKLAELNVVRKKAEAKVTEIKAVEYKKENESNIMTVDKLAQMRQETPVTEKPPVVEPPWASGGTDQVRIVNKVVKPSPTISLTEIPNIINGAVYDNRGAPLDGAVLVIKDKSGNSVRALKTNRVGQFIVSTPLANGEYYLEFELKNYTFNIYEILLDGKVVKPLNVRGKYVEPNGNT